MCGLPLFVGARDHNSSRDYVKERCRASILEVLLRVVKVCQSKILASPRMAERPRLPAAPTWQGPPWGNSRGGCGG
jgi:hypothetical protein